MTTADRQRLSRSLLGGLFGLLFALALTGVLLAFLALKRDDLTGLVATIVVAVAGFAAGFWWDWRRGINPGEAS